MWAISDLKRLLVLCVVIIGAAYFFFCQEIRAKEYTDKDGKNFEAVLIDVCIGQVGIRRNRGQLQVAMEFYTAVQAGIVTEPLVVNWREYNKFVENRWRAKCLAHVVRIYDKELGWKGRVKNRPSIGDGFKEKLTTCLQRRQIIFQMRKRGNNILMYPACFGRFMTKNGHQLIPLMDFEGTPHAEELQKAFHKKKASEMDQQIELMRLNRQKMWTMEVQINALAPMGAFGPVFNALGPGARRTQIIALRRQQGMENMILQHRELYLRKLLTAK